MSRISAIRSVAVFCIGHIGDSVVMLPTLYKIRNRHPGQLMYVILNKPQEGTVSGWDVFEATGLFEDKIYFTRFSMSSAITLCRKISQLDVEVLYYLPPRRPVASLLRDFIFFRYLCRASRVVGINIAVLWASLTRSIISDRTPEWLRLFRSLEPDYPADLHFPLLHPRFDAVERVDGLLEPLNGSGACLVAIGPGSKMPAKVWPVDRYSEIMNRLLCEHPAVRCIIIGDQHDAVVGAHLEQAFGYRRVLSIAGRTSISESAEALRRCKLFIGNDSGPMHLAAAMGVRCVAIFSARDVPGRWSPYGIGHKVLRHEVHCSGCLLEICPWNNRCINLVSVEEVWSAVGSALRDPVA